MKVKVCLVITLMFISVCLSAQTAQEYYDEAVTAFDSGEFKIALKAVDKAIQMNPKEAVYYEMKGACHGRLKDFGAQLDAYDQGLEALPNSSDLYNERGLFYQYAGKNEFALRNYGLALRFSETAQDSCIAINNRAVIEMMTRMFEVAYDDLIMAYRLDSTYVPTLVNLGAVCDEVGRDDEVLSYYFKAIELDSTEYRAVANVGFHYQVNGDYEKSSEYFEKLLAQYPEDPILYNNLAYNKLKLGDIKGALKDVNQSLSIYPNNSYAYRNRALIYLEMGKEKKACEDIESALAYGFAQQYGAEVSELQRKYCR